MELIGLSEVARRKKVERTTAYRWVQAGRLVPVMKMEGDTGALLFDAEVVDAFITPAEQLASERAAAKATA